jgi:O-succinylbenzoic acid--CoA ligase
VKLTFSNGLQIINAREQKLEQFLDDELTQDEKYLLKFFISWQSKRPSFDFHTSGSTGKPKKIQLSRAQLTYSAEQTLSALHLRSQGRDKEMLLCISPRFIGGMMLALRAWLSDAHLRILPPTTDFSDIHTDIDLCSLVPLQVEKLLSLPQRIPFFKNVLIGGAPLSRQLEQQLLRHLNENQNWWATYGMTETASHVALRPLGEATYQGIGDVVFQKNPQGCLSITGTITQHQTLVTHDMVDLHSRNTFTWLGRKDNVINTGGIKVMPEKIEAYLTRIMPEVELTVTWVTDDHLGQKMICLVAGAPTILSTDLEGLSPYERPKQFIKVQQLPKTSNGKIDRKGAQQLAERLYQPS